MSVAAGDVDREPAEREVSARLHRTRAWLVLITLWQRWCLWRVDRRSGGFDGQMAASAIDAYARLAALHCGHLELTGDELDDALDELEATGDRQLLHAWCSLYRRTHRHVERVRASQRAASPVTAANATHVSGSRAVSLVRPRARRAGARRRRAARAARPEPEPPRPRPLEVAA
jgi:hypothetical protein